MNRAAEQIPESSYHERPDYWIKEAFKIGGIEVCSDETGQPLFTIGLLGEW
ncbi:hypothetical protein [Carnobacterium mobile]|uniref:hypothetical protein n=1 Tax=Carnobacterium mobile TaxID=2750 RepID=UPI000AAC77E7|nr:hypothetical protein [Carnobacterium mobile]